MDGAKYRARDLRLGWSFTFQDDNRPNHTDRHWSGSKQRILMLECPSQKSDLNPIEYL